MKIISTDGKETVIKKFFTFKLATAAILLAASLILFASCSRQSRYPAPARLGRNIAVDVASLPEEVPVFFTYEYQDRPVSFFVLKLNGKILSFLDACASCYTQKRGYSYSDGHVSCRACGMNFPVSKLEQGLGSCYPIRIEGRMENGKYLIPVALLEAQAGKF